MARREKQSSPGPRPKRAPAPVHSSKEAAVASTAADELPARDTTSPSSMIELEQRAEAGDGVAACKLGDHYKDGDLISQDLVVAFRWYSRGAELGNREAQNNLGSMFLNGLGCKLDQAQAIHWYRASAEQGLAIAQFNLAKRYLHGDGIDRDYTKALDWFRKAAVQGETWASCEIGTMYRFGQGVPRNPLAAAEFHLIAADRGDDVAIGNLSRYRVELEELALSGSQMASLFLCRIYNRGFGVEKSQPMTWAWISWAKKHCAYDTDADSAEEATEAYEFYHVIPLESRRQGERRLAEMRAAHTKRNRKTRASQKARQAPQSDKGGVMIHDYRGELDCAVRAATAAGTLLRGAFHSGEPEIDHCAEEEIQKILTAGFPQYGYHGEELGFVSPPQDSTGHLWLVDPDDGTAAFEKGFRGASVSIALLRDGRPVLGVVYAYCAPDDAGDCFTWAEGAGPVKRNGSDIRSPRAGVPETVLVSHHADQNPQANAILAAPMRYRAVPSIAYRLALVAAGESRVAVSLNGPVGWDYAGGHALLLGAGMELYDQIGEPICYDRNGNSSCGGRCFGGPNSLVQELKGRDWNCALRRVPKKPEPYSICWPKRGCTVNDAGLLARAQGCMLGQLAGDALGGLVEFESAALIRQNYPAGVRLLEDGGHWSTLGGQPTDDSEMALALARSIVKHGAYEPDAAARAFAWWYKSNPFDIGNATRTAVSAAAAAVRAGKSAAEASRSAALPDSQANGALMRVSPLGILGSGAEEGKAGEWAQEDALLTHPNPVCQHANRVYAETLAFAIRTGGNRKQIHRFALEVAKRAESPQSVTEALVKAASKPPDDYSRQMGWVLIALQNAFWQLLHAESLEEGIVSTVISGGDTDTNAAIAGALLGAVHGRNAIPLQWLDRILSCRPISGIAGVKRPRPEAFRPVDALWLAERLLWLGRKRQPN
jgi:ADP-ribosylglycohydrolase/TPR repeat protein/fructose-1,6-bisphosphatase/inositol monophosphatase family enzyme